jgi:hypothetical protein
MRALLGVACSFWALSVIEIAVEISGVAPVESKVIEVWLETDARQLDDVGAAFQPHDEWLWAPRPGASYRGDVVNEQGTRGPVLEPGAGDVPRFVTLGDSSTFGFGVRDEECFARRLEAIYRDRGSRIEVLNLGCIGFSAVQAAAIYRGKARAFRPDLVILAVGAVNEHFPVPPGQSDHEKLRLLRERGGKTLRWLRRFATVRALESLLRAEETSVPTADRAPDDEEPDPVPRVSIVEFTAALNELADAIAADGAKLLVVIPPKREDAERSIPVLSQYSDALRAFAAERNLPVADVYSRFRELDHADPEVRESPLRSSRFLDAYHPSSSGHLLYAELLAEAITRHRLIPEQAR